MNERHNLQFCNVMVNYDLLWNPMKVEQRIGRIHRIGQDQEVYVFNITLEAFPDAKITVFHVVGEPSAMWGEAMGLALADDIDQAAREHASDAFEAARAIVDEYDERSRRTCKLAIQPARF